MSPTAHRVDREFQIMDALNKSGSNVPVPKVHCLCINQPEVLGSNFYVMDFIDARLFKDVLLPEVKASDRKPIWYSAVDALAALHDVDTDKAGLKDYGPKTPDFFKRQVRTFVKVSAAQFAVDPKQVPALPNLESCAQKISALVREDLDEPRPCISHGDYKMDNLLYDNKENKVVAILDWEMSTIGAFGADLANLLLPFYIPENSNSAFAMGRVDQKTCERAPTGDELLKRYCEKRKNPKVAYEVMQKRVWLYLAFQFFKFGVILQGIAARSVRGTASSSKAALVGALAPSFDELAVWALDEFDKRATPKM